MPPFHEHLLPDQCVRGCSHLSPERLWELGRAPAVRAGLRLLRPPSGRASWRWRTRRKLFNKEIASYSSVPVVAVNRVGSAPEYVASSSSSGSSSLTCRTQVTPPLQMLSRRRLYRMPSATKGTARSEVPTTCQLPRTNCHLHGRVRPSWCRGTAAAAGVDACM